MMLIKTIIILSSIYIAICFFLYFIQEKVIFFPTTLKTDYPFNEFSNAEEIFFPCADGTRLHALHFKVAQPKGIVLYFHGNARGLEDWGHAAIDFTSRGYEVLMQDYRTYGKSTGQLSEKTFHKDAQMLYDHLLLKWKENDIIIYGRSLGSGVASELGTKTHPRQIILETPYLSLLKMASGRFPYFPASIILKYHFRNDLNIKQLKAPVFLFHGTIDELIPYKQAVELENIYGKKILTTIEGAGHNNLGAFKGFQDRLAEILHIGEVKKSEILK